ncbi:MAG: histidine kinase [Clostridia bacterium]|nr:histidine kinase [Clostridia bacterium]
MQEFINKLRNFPKTYLKIAGVLSLILLAVGLLWFNKTNSNQAVGATPVQIYFEGRYRIGDGDWQPIKEGQHIPASKGDVTLQGNFHMLTPSGEYIGLFKSSVPIAFYTDHINLTFYESGKTYVIDHENPLCGVSACGQAWTSHAFQAGNTEPIEILVHNPHSFGNENAIDEMLSNVAIWGNIDFEKDVLDRGEAKRNVGILFMLVSIVFLGIALFASLIHIKNSKIIWSLGLGVLFAGLYFAYSSEGISFWSESVISNTTILGFAMMFYMLFISLVAVSFLKTTKMVGNVTLVLLGLANAVFFAVPMVTEIFFYDTWIWWIAVQLVANIVLSVCLIKEFIETRKKERWVYMGVLLPLIAFAVDAVGTWSGVWMGGLISQYVFVILFAVAMIMVLQLIPHNINAATKARELELEKITLNAQLAESRISTMMSQIRPHFIYNTLGSIEQLCKLDPPKAGDLVHNFAKYLRGNFGELDNPKPILMSQEMEHVRHYISIENVRFPDMTFTFEMNSEDFCIPALTVQPIVENAIKHGLMKLSKGGTIRVISYDTETDYCISVVDDGIGFDTSALQEDRKHVGLRNIRERLKVMVNGTLEIESTIGVGTKVLIKIPKEVRK